MSDRPNLLILMADQLRQDALGCYGHPVIRTPHLDGLAASGVRFSHACCPTPICVASRMSFITGQRAGRHHVTANEPLPGPVPELPTLMSLLLRAGYTTQGVGKMHFGGRHYGFQSLLRLEEGVDYRIDDDYLLFLKAQGVRARYPQGLRDLLYYQPQTSGLAEAHSQSRWVADRSCEFLREQVRHRPGVPFLLWSSWLAPHPPFAPCAPYDRLYDPATLPPPDYPERPLASLPGTARGHRARLEGAHLDPPRMQRIRALYAGQVSHVDACLGSVLDELARLGLAENTAVLFLSDHGDMLGDHGLSQKNVPYRASVSIPMLLRWPGRTTPGKVCADLVGVEDFLPTVLDALHLPYDGELPGASLLGAPGGGLRQPRPWYAIDYGHGESRWRSLRSHTHAYTWWACGGHEELYDLAADPDERHNLAAALPAETAAWRERARAWETRWGLPPDRAGDPWQAFPAWPPDRLPPGVTVNEGRWPEHLPPDEQAGVETYAEAFSRAIRDETTLTPDRLSLAIYKQRGGHPLTGTPWQAAWERA
jgi:arylsulfatase A-like enzyme